MRSAKPTFERRLFDAFVHSIPDLAGGAVDQPDPPEPDIVYTVGGQVIGVELTELVARQSIRRDEGEQSAVLAGARAIYEEAGHPPAAVAVSWAPSVSYDKSARRSIAANLAALVAANVPSPGDWRELGEGGDAHGTVDHPAFERIWIVSAGPNEPHADWESLHNWSGADADRGFLQRHISRKDDKPSGYTRRYDARWLLLYVRGNTPASGFDLAEEALHAVYVSPYDRIFVLDVLRHASHELTTQAGSP